MSMFQKTVIALLEGATLCETSAPTIMNYLHDDDGFGPVGDHLAAMGMEIKTCAGGRAIHAQWIDGSAEAQKAARETAKDAYDEAYRIQEFLRFLLDTSEDGALKAMGDPVRAADLSAAVARSSAARDDLHALASLMRVNAATDHAKISDILRKLRETGYLHCIDKARERYLLTGKIDRAFAVIEALGPHVGVEMDADEEDDRQGVLI